MKIVSYNVNGLKARIKQYKSLKCLLETLDADLICFQETKLTRGEITEDVAIADGYESFFSFCKGSRRGRTAYSGVATFCRVSSPNKERLILDPTAHQVSRPVAADEGFTGLLHASKSGRMEDLKFRVGGYECVKSMADSIPNQQMMDLDSEGRCLVTDHGSFVLFNIYAPRVESGDDQRLQFKMNFFRVLQARWQSLMQEGRRVVAVGDFNIAPAVIDTCHVGRKFSADPCRQWLQELLTCQLAGQTFCDTFRLIHPNRANAFTCWVQATGAEEFNYGSRIDLILLAGPCLAGTTPPIPCLTTGDHGGLDLTIGDQSGQSLASGEQAGLSLTAGDRRGPSVTNWGQPGHVMTTGDQPERSFTAGNSSGRILTTEDQSGPNLTTGLQAAEQYLTIGGDQSGLKLPDGDKAGPGLTSEDQANQSLTIGGHPGTIWTMEGQSGPDLSAKDRPGPSSTAGSHSGQSLTRRDVSECGFTTGSRPGPSVTTEDQSGRREGCLTMENQAGPSPYPTPVTAGDSDTSELTWQCHSFGHCEVADCNLMEEFKRTKGDSMPRWSGGRTLRLEGSDHIPVYVVLKSQPYDTSVPRGSIPLATRFFPELSGRQQKLVDLIAKSSSGKERLPAGRISLDNGRKVKQKVSQMTVTSFFSRKERQRGNDDHALDRGCQPGMNSNDDYSSTSEACPPVHGIDNHCNMNAEECQPGMNPNNDFNPCQPGMNSNNDSDQRQPGMNPNNDSNRCQPGTKADNDSDPCQPGDELEDSPEGQFQPGRDIGNDISILEDECQPGKNDASEQRVETSQGKDDLAVHHWLRIQRVMASSLPLCKGHNEPCVFRMVKKGGTNQGRGFYVCARGQAWTGSSFSLTTFVSPSSASSLCFRAQSPILRPGAITSNGPSAQVGSFQEGEFDMGQ